MSDVCLTFDDVCRVHREYSWNQQLLEARRTGRRGPGVRRVWAGAGPQRAAYRGRGISWRPPAYSLLIYSAVQQPGRDVGRHVVKLNQTTVERQSNRSQIVATTIA